MAKVKNEPIPTTTLRDSPLRFDFFEGYWFAVGGGVVAVHSIKQSAESKWRSAMAGRAKMDLKYKSRG